MILNVVKSHNQKLIKAIVLFLYLYEQQPKIFCFDIQLLKMAKLKEYLKKIQQPQMLLMLYF